jgi:hypothetical protein
MWLPTLAQTNPSIHFSSKSGKAIGPAWALSSFRPLSAASPPQLRVVVPRRPVLAGGHLVCALFAQCAFPLPI